MSVSLSTGYPEMLRPTWHSRAERGNTGGGGRKLYWLFF